MPSREHDASDPADSLPSDAELRILRELWEGGEATVATIRERLEAVWPVAYTTVLKLLQRLLDKGLVDRRADGRAHVYRAVVDRASTERRVARRLVEDAFGGSLHDFVTAALPRSRVSRADLEEIQRILEELEGGEGGGGGEVDEGGEGGGGTEVAEGTGGREGAGESEG